MRACLEALIKGVLVAALDSRYTQIGFNLISVQVCEAKFDAIRTMTFSSHLQVLGNPLLGSASLDLGEVSNQLLDRMLLITELIDQGVVVADDAHEDTRLPDVVLDVSLGHGSQLHLFQSLLILAAACLGEDHVPSLPDH